MKKAAATRLDILRKAFELIYVKGYQTTSIDDILTQTSVTKGAFYYHFKNKDEMGLAIIHELLKPALQHVFVDAFQREKNPLHAIYNVIHHLLMDDEFMKVEYGCPAGNLTQEMTPWNAEFAKALRELTSQWEKTLIKNIEKGKKEGYIRPDINARQVALFLMSGYWGVRTFGKLENSQSVYRIYLKELKNYLESLQ